MRASILAGLLAAGCAHAFSDSSPFLLFSTAEFTSAQPPAQLQTSTGVVSAAKDILSQCPTTKYLLVSQPNVHATDLDGPEGCGVHRIRSAVTSDAVHGRYTVAEVVPTARGNMSFDGFSAHIQISCAANGVEAVNVRGLTLASLPASPDCHARAEAMDDNDYALGTILQEELSTGDYTVLFFSTFHDGKPYEANFENPSQIHIKKPMVEHDRPVARQVAGRADSSFDDASLFVKYQFFTPGIFMTLTVLFLLMSVLYVGLTSLASLQVSYGAFDKEMGPAAQKKQN